MKNILINKIFLYGVVLASWVGCTPMDQYYKDLVELGDRIYVGKLNDISVGPGKQRLKLSWGKTVDPSVSQVNIYWNDYLDSVVYSIAENQDTSEVIIENLSEGYQTFHIVTLDQNGNRSLPAEINVDIYGEGFQNTIRNRVIRNFQMFPDSVVVVWYEELSETMQKTELQYVRKDGTVKKILIPKSASETVFKDIDLNKEISFRSLFLPVPHAIDTFMTDYQYADLLDHQLTSLHLDGVGTTTADFIDFSTGRVQKFDDAKEDQRSFDLAHLRGTSSKHNLIAMDNSAGFGSFSSTLRTMMDTWSVRNQGWLVNLGNSAESLELYNNLNSKDRNAMKLFCEDAADTATPSGRLTLLEVGDIIAFHSVDRELYIAMKVVEAADDGDLTIDFKISRP